MKTKLMLSGILQGLRFNAVAGIAGLLLLLLGFLVFTPLKFIGAAALVFYLLISILQPVRQVGRISKELGEEELERALEDLSGTTEARGRRLSYRAMMIALEDRIEARRGGPSDDTAG